MEWIFLVCLVAIIFCLLYIAHQLNNALAWLMGIEAGVQNTNHKLTLLEERLASVEYGLKLYRGES